MRPASRLPMWLKVGWTLWVAAWAPCYWVGYGPQNLLWFCGLANFGIAAGLWLESSLLVSWQAVSVTLVQLVWSVDFLGVLATGRHWIGGTEYMFDPSHALHLRLLSLYHLVQPWLVLWVLGRLGYHARGWLWQTATAWVVLPVCWLFPPALDINWVWGPFDRPQSLMPPAAYLAVTMAAYPLLVYLPSHLVLVRVFGGGGRLAGPAPDAPTAR